MIGRGGDYSGEAQRKIFLCRAHSARFFSVYAGTPQAVELFSPTPITQAITLVYSIKVHAPVLGLTVSTVLVPCSGVTPRHCGVSPNSSAMVLNTFSVLSQITGLFNLRVSAAASSVTVNRTAKIKKVFIWYLIKQGSTHTSVFRPA